MIGIGRLSNQTGVHIETIRYYERIGIMPAPPRTAGGHRTYDETHTKRLSFIARSRQLGFSLDEIRELLSLVDDNEFTCSEVRSLTLNHAAEVSRKIEDLKKIERTLSDMAAKCTSDDVTDQVPDCPIIDTLLAES